MLPTSSPLHLDSSRFYNSAAGRAAIVIVTLIITVGIILTRDRLESLGLAGYPLVFIASLLGSATIFFPGPNILLILALDEAFNPLALGLVAGLGAAGGELTGYLIGWTGTKGLPHKTPFRYLERWMRKADVLTIFGFAVIPNPFADVGGILAGALKVPLGRFLIASWLGKSLRFSLLAHLSALM